MATVYVVDWGKYSDREVAGVFSTLEAAEAFAAEVDKVDGSGGVLEFTLDERVGERASPRWVVYIGCESGTTTPPKIEHAIYPDTPLSTCIAAPMPWGQLRSDFRAFLAEGEPVIMVRSEISAENALNLAATARRDWLRSRAVAGAENR